DLAVADLTKAQKIKPEKPDNWSARSNIYFAMGEYDKAVADVTNAIKIAPGNLRLYGARAQIYRKMGKIDLAKRDEVKAKTGDLDF
ncbi:MAG: tetratricopeptide repeat protein, partial [Cyanobacteria bacterium SZAS LIN-2]|nr:tetratricopeptide repeat protein [Cyanobacteria bacterium SZAS LIN-2]